MLFRSTTCICFPVTISPKALQRILPPAQQEPPRTTNIYVTRDENLKYKQIHVVLQAPDDANPEQWHKLPTTSEGEINYFMSGTGTDERLSDYVETLKINADIILPIHTPTTVWRVIIVNYIPKVTIGGYPLDIKNYLETQDGKQQPPNDNKNSYVS